MKKSFKRNYRVYIYYFLVSLTLVVVVALSCKKQASSFSSDTKVQSSYFQQESASGSSLIMTRELALDRINALFKGELSHVNTSQVQGINKQQFIQWLRNSNIAKAEQNYLGHLLSSDVSEFILIKNVIVVKTGKPATIAMVSVPTQLYNRYTKVLVLTDYSGVIGRLCFWFQCDYLDPNMCLCLARIGSISLASRCPASECDPLGEPCRTPSGEPCEDPHFDQVIKSW